MFLSRKLDCLLALILMPLALPLPLSHAAAQGSVASEGSHAITQEQGSGRAPVYSGVDILAGRIPGDSLSDLVTAVSRPIPDQVIAFHKKVRENPFMRSAAQRVCAAKYEILQGEAEYYPKIDFTLSGGNKIVDETTRADEYGGTNSPEHDGSGLNATMTVRQHLFDWGRLNSVIQGSRQGQYIARIEEQLTLSRQVFDFYSTALDYQLRKQAQIAPARRSYSVLRLSKINSGLVTIASSYPKRRIHSSIIG